MLLETVTAWRRPKSCSNRTLLSEVDYDADSSIFIYINILIYSQLVKKNEQDFLLKEISNSEAEGREKERKFLLTNFLFRTNK